MNEARRNDIVMRMIYSRTLPKNLVLLSGFAPRPQTLNTTGENTIQSVGTHGAAIPAPPATNRRLHSWKTFITRAQARDGDSKRKRKLWGWLVTRGNIPRTSKLIEIRRITLSTPEPSVVIRSWVWRPNPS